VETYSVSRRYLVSAKAQQEPIVYGNVASLLIKSLQARPYNTTRLKVVGNLL
jgi:hypothetical protein